MLALKLFPRQRIVSDKLNVFKLQISPSLRLINTSSPKLLSGKAEATHQPNHLEKYLLVWMKRYPSVAEVPREVSPIVMERVRNQARIKITIILMILTGIVCVGMIYSGKQAAKRGESIRKMNIDWHKEQEKDEKK